MPRTEDGEFELVLGNKQLLSVFFIVVVLISVFTAMGYVAGRNSATAANDAKKNADAGKPIVVDNGSERVSPMPASSSPAAQAPAAPPSDTGAGVSRTQPVESAQPAKKPSPAAAAPPARTEKPADVSGPPQIAEPAAGTTWLQVAATRRAEAELVAESLGKRSFQAQLAPGPNGLFRVLVGPLNGDAEIAGTRTKLENEGFRPMVRKY